MDNDFKFNLALKLLDKDLKKDAMIIYKDLYDQKYNHYNIGSWMLNNEDNELYLKNIFNELLETYKDDKDKIEYIKNICYPKFLFNKDKYDLTIDEIDMYEKDYSLLLNNSDFIKKNNPGIFYFNIYCELKNICKIKYLFTKEEVKKYRKDIFNIPNKKKKIAFLLIDVLASPNFSHFSQIYYYLSKINKDIILYLDNDESDLNEYSKKMIKDFNIFYIKNLSDDELYEKMKLENIDILICMYGHYKRYNIILRKPCKVIINGHEGGFIFPSYLFDYCFIFNNKKFISLENSNEYKFIYLKNFFPISKPSDFKLTYTKPEYNKKKSKNWNYFYCYENIKRFNSFIKKSIVT